MSKYPYYYEVTTYDDDDTNRTEGGFIFATDFKEAMNEILALYDPGLVEVTLKEYDELAFIFDLKEARRIKQVFEEAEHVY